MRNQRTLFFFSLILATLSSCHIADLRTREIKKDRQSQKMQQYAQALLDETILKQGMNKIHEHDTYEVFLTDEWKGLMGKIGNPWSWNKDRMVLRYAVGNFDGQVEVLENDKKGFAAGIQSWTYYEKVDSLFQRKVKKDKDKVFMIAAYHYFFELATRLKTAPFIRYAGTGKIGEQEIEKVLVSWSNSRTRKHDQFLLFINRETKLIDAVQFTTRDSSLPGSDFITGSLKFKNYREVDGILIPFIQEAQIGKPTSSTKYLHKLSISEFLWDSFPVSNLQPFHDLKPVGNDKLGQ